jgi:hypothetical protein
MLQKFPLKIFAAALLSAFLSLFSPGVVSQAQNKENQTEPNISSFVPFAIPYNEDTALLVVRPTGWMFYSPSPGEGTFPLIIYPKDNLNISNNELSLSEGIIVDILNFPSASSLENLAEANSKEIKDAFPDLEASSTYLSESFYGFRYITTPLSEEKSGLRFILALARAGEKVIRIKLFSRRDSYQSDLNVFTSVIRTALPLRIGFYGDMLKVQRGAILAPPEKLMMHRLLAEGPYDYWKKYAPGTEVKFRQTQKYSSYKFQFEKSFKLISSDKEAVIMDYREKGTALLGQKASVLPNTEDQQFLELIRTDELFSSKDPFVSYLGLNLSYYLTHPAAVVDSKGKASLPAKDKLLETEWVRYRIFDAAQPRRLTIWFSDDIPGRIVRLLLENLDGTGSHDEIELTSSVAKTASRDELEALEPVPEVTVEVPAISYLQKRLSIMENRISPFYYMVGTTLLFHVFSMYYLDRGVQPAQIEDLLLPFMEELRNLKSEYATFEQIVKEELSHEELNKLDIFLTAYKNYLGSGLRRVESFVELLKASDLKDKDKLKNIAASALTFLLTSSSAVDSVNQIESQLDSLAAITVKVKPQKMPTPEKNYK